MKKKKFNFYKTITIFCIILTTILFVETIYADVLKENNNRIYIDVFPDKTINPNISNNDNVTKNKNKKSKKSNLYSKYEIYELAKIIMCEAEGESQKCKEYVGQVVINRVKSNKFPNNIHDVIFQRNQFTPTFDGRWERVEPNEECYEAAYKVINSSKPLTRALYFEACEGDSWHSRNLVRVAKIDSTRFYIE